MKNGYVLLLILCLSACPSKPNNNAATNAGITEDLSAGLKGVDANSNGIRDDIDALIAVKYSQTPAIKKAAEQKALALQGLMEATSKEQALLAAEKLIISGSCVYEVLPLNNSEHQEIRIAMSRDLEAMTANTRERMVKYLDSNSLVGGGYFVQPVAPFCN